MFSARPACDPRRNVTVKASAGTGKTWLLVARLIRLLLEGARPDAILAVTFTRKAAAEMQERLSERLFELASCETATLSARLESIGADPSPAALRRARHLYEQLLRTPRRIKITTFHAFAQEILRRFPMEADVPAGFELVEQTSLLEIEAFDRLTGIAAQAPDGPVAAALEKLFQQCNGLTNTRRALDEFLQRRSDWWSFTDGQRAPVDFACTELARTLEIQTGDAAAPDFFTGEVMNALSRFSELITQHPTDKNQKTVSHIAKAQDVDAPEHVRLAAVTAAFLRSDGHPLARKASQKQRAAMGEDGERELLALHDRICEDLAHHRDVLARYETLEQSSAWFLAGAAYVDCYQELKRSRRLLDFTDLEWKAYDLLRHGDNAHWVQYKLDQRIDHLLVDEFQDTNPTQWNLLLPLLQELAAGSPERARSVFLVGDSKQSIYGFRRADPGLFDHAHCWLTEHLGGQSHPLDISRRSSPAIVELVNHVFDAPELRAQLSGFHPHETHLRKLWGRTELLALPEREEPGEAAGAPELRIPLDQPRAMPADLPHLQEGRGIAARIGALLNDGETIQDGDRIRPVRYSDILILVRNRTHIHAYELALRELGIPYAGADRGSLLSSLETIDMLSLLDTLLAPFDDLALATVLRSPLFDCSDDDLMRLADPPPGCKDKTWMGRLEKLAQQLPDESPLRRAWACLRRWRGWVGQLPAHDLLDRIYFEGDVLARYQAAFPDPLRPRVMGHLTQFIELALEMDSGRYPSLARFRDLLQRMRQRAPDATDEPPAPGPSERVRILTIHGAKGLEAPVVFLADSATSPRPLQAYQALVRWPPGAPRPTRFQLIGRKSVLDTNTSSALDAYHADALREETNLLYVALTRARQFLFVSASPSARTGNLGWYGTIRRQIEPHATRLADHSLVIDHGCAPRAPALHPAEPATDLARSIDPRLQEPPRVTSAPTEVNPSAVTDAVDPAWQDHALQRYGLDPGETRDGRLRGACIHSLLELLAAHALDTEPDIARAHLSGHLGVSDALFQDCWSEALEVFRAPRNADLFDSRHYRRAYSEVPMLYRSDGRLVHGVIDRLVVRDDEVMVIDFKTHRDVAATNQAHIAETCREQMQCYARGVQKLYPKRRIRCILLFTICNRRHELSFDMPARGTRAAREE